jgi:flagellar motor switch protein FliN/FliY
MRTTPLASAVHDVEIEISVVIGNALMPVHQLLKMGRGAVIELDATLDDHAWIYANNRLIARGEIVIVGEQVAVSITETIGLGSQATAA